MMPKKEKTPYNKRGLSDGLAFLQKLVNDKRFKWTLHLDSKDVAFIYDMVSKANTFRDFYPTAAQSKYIVSLATKIKLIERSEKQAPKKKPVKGRSPKVEHAARRKAKAFLIAKGHGLEKSSPSNVEFAKKLFELGELDEMPTKKASKSALVAWYNRVI